MKKSSCSSGGSGSGSSRRRRRRAGGGKTREVERPSISGRGCYGANNRRLKRKNKGLAVHHRDFRSGRGFAEGTRGKKKGRSDEEAEGGEGGPDPHIHCTYAATYRPAYPRRQGHYRIITYHTYRATTMMARVASTTDELRRTHIS